MQLPFQIPLHDFPLSADLGEIQQCMGLDRRHIVLTLAQTHIQI